jgi:hypothetical protein
MKSYDDACSDPYRPLPSFSLGIVSALLGSPVGETGLLLLKQSLQLFERVQSKVDREPLSKDWSMLQLSVLNNQACVLSDLCMHDQILERLVKMGITLTKAYDELEPSDMELFRWTIQMFLDDMYAPAA